MASKASTAVRIGGKDYKVRSGDDPTAIQKVADFVDQTMERIRSRTKTIDSEDVAVLAALNIANDLVALREGRATGEGGTLRVSPKRVETLVELIDSVESP